VEMAKVGVCHPLPYLHDMRLSPRFLSEDWRWGMLEYSTLTDIPSGMGVRPLYEGVWLLAITWP
jgi:hypothetical protein